MLLGVAPLPLEKALIRHCLIVSLFSPFILLFPYYFLCFGISL